MHAPNPVSLVFVGNQTWTYYIHFWFTWCIENTMLLSSATDASSQSCVCSALSCRELAVLGLFVTMVDPPSHEPQLRVIAVERPSGS